MREGNGRSEASRTARGQGSTSSGKVILISYKSVSTNGMTKGWNTMKVKDNSFYRKRGLSPRERVELDNLRAENEQLKQITQTQDDALIELATLIEEVSNG